MPTTFTWSIPAHGLMTKTENGNEDTVVRVRYVVAATDGTHTVDTHQLMELTPSTDGVFVPFAELTEDQVLSWVKAALPDAAKTQLETMLANTLAIKANPPVRPVVKASPWTCSQA